jgi:hypothetical protein
LTYGGDRVTGRNITRMITPLALGSKGVKTAFDVNADSAPVIYVHHQPARTKLDVRNLERTFDALRGDDLATGGTGVKMTNYLADPVELKILHMIIGDPKRTPSFVVFGNPSSGNTAARLAAAARPASPSRAAPMRGTTGPSPRRSTRPGLAWSGLG